MTNNFTTHHLNIKKKGQSLIVTDGFLDQFGGEYFANVRPGDMKYKSANFKKLLLKIKDNPIDQQKMIVENTFED